MSTDWLLNGAGGTVFAEGITLAVVVAAGLVLLLAVVLLVPAAILLVEVLAARRVMAGASPIAAAWSDPSARGRLAALIPAHNEAAGIAGVVADVRSQLRPGDRLLVVADNCTDATASLARGAGAEVVERTDTSRRGKGYALDCGVRHLELDQDSLDRSVAVVVVIDADCRLSAGTLDRLAAASLATGRPAQARYLMSHPPEVTAIGARIAQFAWIVKNWVRPLGLGALGLPCPLFGTGMAFPWPVIRDAALATGNIVEDMKLAVDLTAKGTAPLFVPTAHVDSVFPLTVAGQDGQRKRWEHGHLDIITHDVPALLWQGVKRFDRASVSVALDLAVPPLALLVMLIGVVNAASLGMLMLAWLLAPAAFGLSVAAVGVAALALVSVVSAVLGAWSAFARKVLPTAMLAGVPRYALRKLSVYTGFVSARQTAWERARRDQDAD